MPIRCPRSRAISRSELGSGTPSSDIVPPITAPSGNRPVTARAVSVLPDPLSPIMPKRSPRCSEKLTSATASLAPKRTDSPETSSKDIGISLPQSGVDGVTQSVAGNIERNDDQHDCQARHQRQPRMDQEQALCAPQHQAKARFRRLRPETN